MDPDRGLGWGRGENAEQVGAKDETMAVMESPMSIRIAAAVAVADFIFIMVNGGSLHTPPPHPHPPTLTLVLIQSLSTHLATTKVDRQTF